MLGFLFGVVAGGLAGYFWRENIRDYVSNRVPDLRARAADRLGTLGQRANSALDRARSSIDSTVRTGQERLRPSGKAGGDVRESGPSSAGEHR